MSAESVSKAVSVAILTQLLFVSRALNAEIEYVKRLQTAEAAQADVPLDAARRHIMFRGFGTLLIGLLSGAYAGIGVRALLDFNMKLLPGCASLASAWVFALTDADEHPVFATCMLINFILNAHEALPPT